MSEIIMNYSHHKISSKKSKSLLDEMDDMGRESISMISSFRPKAEKKSKVDELQEANTDGDDYAASYGLVCADSWYWRNYESSAVQCRYGMDCISCCFPYFGVCADTDERHNAKI